jgi:poly(3-hydroxybutyrate) depolymerase
MRPVERSSDAGRFRRVLTAAGLLLACGPGCREAASVPPAVAKPAPPRRGQAELLACLGAPPEARYEPDRLADAPAPGLTLHLFEQETKTCGRVTRRYVSYVPRALGPRAGAPVVIVLHGQGASAEAMMTFQTRGVFNALADQDGFVVVYGNGLPSAFDIAGLANSGRWRSEYTDDGATVDEVGYLARIVEDLTARAVIAGGNDVYLVGQSNGGGMALSAARQRPDAYAGVAAFMPFVGFSPSPPADLTRARLHRVMLAYSEGDPALPPGYASAVLVPLARGWAHALGVSDRDLEAPLETALPDTVKEGRERGGAADGDVVQATRESTVKRLDLRANKAALRQLVFDHAGHFWPTPAYADPPALVEEYGLRNQDVDGARETWRFFRE